MLRYYALRAVNRIGHRAHLLGKAPLNQRF